MVNHSATRAGPSIASHFKNWNLCALIHCSVMSWNAFVIVQYMLPFIVNQSGSVLYYFTLSSVGK